VKPRPKNWSTRALKWSMRYSITCFLARLIAKIFGDLKVEYRTKLPPKGQAFIYAANHMTHLDPPLLAATCPHQLGFLAKEELFENKIFGGLISAMGAIPLDRKSGDVGALRTALKMLKNNKPLVMFPQGTRGKSLDDYTDGVGFIAKKSKAPVYVAHIHGAESIFPKGAKFFRFGKIRIVIDKVSDIDEADDYHQIAVKVMAKIKSL